MGKIRVIDTHAHMDENYDPHFFEQIQKDGIIKEIWMQSLDFVTPPHYSYAKTPEVVKAAKQFPDLVIPFGYIDWEQGPDQIRRLKDMGCVGLKAFRPILPYNDYSYFPIYEEADKLGMPILFHVGIIARRRRETMVNPNYCIGPDKMRPCYLDAIAAEFPRLKLIQGHMGVPWCNELFESLWYYDNINASVSGLIDWKWLMENLDRRSESGVPYHQKMMFSTDFSYGGSVPAETFYEYANFVNSFFDYVGNTYNWGSAKEDFLYNNAIRFMNDKN